jgi:hypothetical protein
MTVSGSDLFQIADFGRQISFGLMQTTDSFVGSFSPAGRKRTYKRRKNQAAASFKGF